MITIRGLFREGVAEPSQPVEGGEGQPVTITFLEEEPAADGQATTDEWDALPDLLDASEPSTGIEDLAHQHDHYLYGTPKRDQRA